MKSKAARIARNEARQRANEEARLRSGTVKVAPKGHKASEPSDRDGFVWLAKKRLWMSPPLVGAGLHYRDLVRTASPGRLPSSVEALGAGSGGQGGGMPFGGSFADNAAQLELFVIRAFTLGGQVDLVTVMDGVCGVGHTLRYLAGGDQRRAAELETALRIALDLVASARAAKLKKAA